MTLKGLGVGFAVWIPGAFLAMVFPPALLLVPFFSAYPAVLFGCGFLPALVPSIAAEALLAWRMAGVRDSAQQAGGDAVTFFSFLGVMLAFAFLGGLISAMVGAWAARWEVEKRKEGF